MKSKFINAALALFVLFAASPVSKAHGGLIHGDLYAGHFSATGQIANIVNLPNARYWHRVLHDFWDASAYAPEQTISTKNIPAVKATSVSNPSAIALLGLLLITLATQRFKRQQGRKAVVKANCAAGHHCPLPV
ncbi:hypothetical protein [Thalassomonas sp. RHCl1]|uniref:hypothetical protein n=1 Tax=Thalassomonas sp. RHCl1 TaxID=2995320 RepID=UPI00248BD178|nr:hypothetical protein [Thalassomonas sp. RHCl1]